MFKTRMWMAVLALASVLSFSPSIFAFDIGGALLKTAGTAAKNIYEAATSKGSVTVPAQGQIEVAFSPKGGGQALIIKTINSAQSEIRMLAYSFTSPEIVEALIRAKKRGVDVKLVADYDQNVDPAKDRSGRARAALSALKNSGADVRVISTFAIHHDKLILVDGRTIQGGSYNYSAAAETRNSEYVEVHWDNPGLAAVYLQHFTRNYRLSKDYVLQY